MTQPNPSSPESVVLPEEIEKQITVLIENAMSAADREPAAPRNSLALAHRVVVNRDSLRSLIAKHIQEAREERDAMKDGLALGNAYRSEALELRSRVSLLEEALRSFVDNDEDECWHDHHGNCQAHLLGNPCQWAVARKLLSKTPEAT